LWKLSACLANEWFEAGDYRVRLFEQQYFSVCVERHDKESVMTKSTPLAIKDEPFISSKAARSSC
jgi:hypothetical protein